MTSASLPGAGALVRLRPAALGLAAAAASLAVLAPLPDRVQAWASAWSVLLAAVIYLAWGTARGELRSRRLRAAQRAAVVGFSVVALVAVSVEPHTARYVLAAGWLAHAGWDAVHHRLGRVVPRWYAETCLAADLLVAAVLLTAGPR